MADNDTLYSAMQEGTPLKSYIKTILGKVYIEVLDPFSDQPMGKILEGDPKKFEKGTIYDVWTTRQEVFLRNRNESQFSNGILVEYVRSNAPREKTIEESTDSELSEIINSKYLGLQAKLNKIVSIPVLFRMVSLAHELDKSDKIIGAIEARLSELQSKSSEPEE